MRGNGAGRRNKGRNVSRGNGSLQRKPGLDYGAAEKAKVGLRAAVACPNMTENAKERIAQNKRARAGSLAIVD